VFESFGLGVVLLLALGFVAFVIVIVWQLFQLWLESRRPREDRDVRPDHWID